MKRKITIEFETYEEKDFNKVQGKFEEFLNNHPEIIKKAMTNSDVNEGIGFVVNMLIDHCCPSSCLGLFIHDIEGILSNTARAEIKEEIFLMQDESVYNLFHEPFRQFVMKYFQKYK